MEVIHCATRRNDVKCLKKVLNANPDLRLGDFKFTSFLRTPLHIAAMLGHVEFAQELIRFSQPLASVIDSKGFTPLHLASTRNNVNMVRVLVDANIDACTALDQDGRTPLHLAAMRNEVEVMELLIEKQPLAIYQVQANRRETILHFCVKLNKFKALKNLVGYLVYAPGPNLISVNSADIDGNTILHLAAQRRQIKMIEYLLESNNIGVDINIGNNTGHRGLQMLAPKEMDDVAQNEMDELEIGCFDYHRAVVKQKRSSINKAKGLKERVNTLMVVAVLIAGIAFQAAVNPPGGVFQDDSKIDSSTDPGMFAYYLNAVLKDNSMSDRFRSYLQNLPDITIRSKTSNTTAAEMITDGANFVKALLETTLNDNSFTATKSRYAGYVAPGIVLDGNRWMSIISNYKSTNTGGAGFSPYLIRYAGSTILAYRYPTTYQVYKISNGLALLLSLFMILLVVLGVIDDQDIPQVRFLALLMGISISCITVSYVSVFNGMSPPFYSSDLIEWSSHICKFVWLVCSGIACLIFTWLANRFTKTYLRILDRDRLQQYAKRRPYFKDFMSGGKFRQSAMRSFVRVFFIIGFSLLFMVPITFIPNLFVPY